jgi:hypothetical protein
MLVEGNNLRILYQRSAIVTNFEEIVTRRSADIKVGEVIRVDTRSGDYVERAK